MRTFPLLFLLACDGGEKEDSGDTDTTISTEQGVRGTIDAPEHCPSPGVVDIWTALSGAAACDWSPEFDTGFNDTGDWTDNVGDIVDSPAVTDDTFESTLDAGDYEARTFDDCYGCAAFTVAEGAVTEVTLALRETVYADAPNLYLYPEEPVGVRVQLASARHIVAADPAYPPDGWQALATPEGTLHTEAGPADFLFYELRLPPTRLQREAGWCVPGHLAQASIEESMALAGFLGAEVEDFSDFWDAWWPEADWMTVYPQTQRLGALRITPAPDSLLRLWFVVEDGCAPVEVPVMPQVTRAGFHAAEWGVVFDQAYGRGWDIVQ